ncbi:MAG TPA: thiamine pyrophosphate-dependent dehydrogenase E1 component subunit alpha [Dehalococcoidia bacterium]|nr:thiamine pyrophosphate-dependent dehydrogenase E1 component subunit alpha [Dehalococcoidia bacterium]
MVRAHESRTSGATAKIHLAMYRDMLRSRELSDRMFALNRQGRAAFAVTGQGHEAAQVGSAYAIKRGVDWVLPYYRDVGVMLALGMTPYDVLLGLFAKADDPASGGRQMPCHWSWPEARVVTRSSVIAANLPHAAGVAYASKLRGLKEVSICYFGEGATSEGDFHEALNFASIHKLPVVFFCENNGYAISESSEKQMAVRHVADRAKGYNMIGQTVDGNDVVAVHQTARWSIEECRRGRGPKLIEAKTYRLVPHTSSDDDRRYRTRAELDEWIKRDPIDRFRKRLIDEETLSEEADAALRADARREIKDAVEAAERAPDPAPEDALRYVFAPPEGA